MSAESGIYWFLFVGIIVALWRLDSIERRLKEIVTEMRKTSQPSVPMTEAEAELEQRRAAIREVQENWPTYK